jgi:hypothetical protein
VGGKTHFSQCVVGMLGSAHEPCIRQSVRMSGTRELCFPSPAVLIHPPIFLFLSLSLGKRKSPFLIVASLWLIYTYNAPYTHLKSQQPHNNSAMSTSQETSPPHPPRYQVTYRMIPRLSPNDTDTSWKTMTWNVIVMLDNISLDFMQSGLRWTTRNIQFLDGQIQPFKLDAFIGPRMPPLLRRQDCVRAWLLREFPGRPGSESQWEGWICLFACDRKTLDGFRLGDLKRQHIHDVEVTDGSSGEVVYRFDPADYTQFKDTLKMHGTGSGHDATDLWWLWPMESVLPETPLADVSPGERPALGKAENMAQSEDGTHVLLSCTAAAVAKCLERVPSYLGYAFLFVLFVGGVTLSIIAAVVALVYYDIVVALL